MRNEAGDEADIGIRTQASPAPADLAPLDDPDTFVALYRRLSIPLWRFLRSRCGSDEDAEDLAHQVFLRAFTARGTFRGDADGQVAWLFRIARNETVSMYRRRGRRSGTVADASDAPGEIADPDPGPEATALSAERRLELWRLVDRLPDGDRDVIQMRFAGGLTTPELARVLGCSDIAARQRLRRALNRLRGWIDDDLA